MQQERPQFDCLLGGPESLPPRLTFSNFAAARAKEIQLMTTFLNTQSGTKLAFQRLPKHLRRRVMSHNVKRLPRRLRQIHLNQMQKSGAPPKQERPSRKFRRRPRNLMDEYFRRQMRCKWLRTHIWYAKRFHMVEKWGYKLPDCPCDKSFRACYRATTKHCLMQDISYYQCIELVGEYQEIVAGFKRITDPTTGLSIGAKAYVNGLREGRITLFKLTPHRQAIGEVDFNWSSSDEESSRKLWIWVHVAFYKETLEALNECFQLNKNDNSGVKLFERNLELSRIRLTGPLSTAILQEAFELVELEQTKIEWLNKYLNNNLDNKTNINKQYEYWKQLKELTTPASLPPHIILPLLIEDPRYHLPKKRTKALTNQQTSSLNNNYIDTPNYLPVNPIWNETCRMEIKNNKLTNAQVDQLRSKTLIPDSTLGVGATVPVLLIQKPGTSSNYYMGYGSGWDLVIPAEWTQTFWLAFIMRGAKVGGLKQNDLINFEMGKTNVLLPDTSAGVAEELDISNMFRENFFKLPPNKRTNYNKFSIVSPLNWNWKMLLRDWNQNSRVIVNDFSVIRSLNELNGIQNLLKSKTRILPSYISPNSLIPIKLECKKGSLSEFAIICLPKRVDYKKEPLEPKMQDKYQQQRKQMRRDHMTLLKKLRRKRIKAKQSNKIVPIDKQMLEEYTKKMRALWLPEPVNIRNSCSREIIGFVRIGAFGLTSGQCVGVGFIASNALSGLLKLDKRRKVLVRNTNSRQYRLADFQVIVD